MRGVFKSNPPKKAKEMPLWSLNGLLTFLDTPQFEPLEKVDYKFLLQKTLTLLLLSSGRRIGEITALSDTSNFNREDSRLYLEWLPTFNPKHNSPTFRPSPPSISRLENPTGVQLTLCPVRAYNIFLNRSTNWHSDVENIQDLQPFWVKPNSTSPSSVPELTRSFKSLVKAYRKSIKLPITIPMGPHQTRKFGASYSIQLKHKKADIIKVMGSKSFTILKKNYVTEVPPLTVSCALPGGSYIYIPQHSLSDSD